MNTETEKQFLEQIKSLNPELQKVFFSDDTDMILENIGASAGLDKFQMSELIDETQMVLIGSSNPENFKGYLIERGIPENTSTNLEMAVNAKIFDKVRQQLNELYKEKPPKKNMSGNNKKHKVRGDTSHPPKPVNVPSNTSDSIPGMPDTDTNLSGPAIIDTDEKLDPENLDIDKVLKEIEAPDAAPQISAQIPEGVAKSSASVQNTQAPSLDVSEETPAQESEKMKSVFEKKLEHFYQTPQTKTHIHEHKQTEEKTASAPPAPPSPKEPVQTQVKKTALPEQAQTLPQKPAQEPAQKTSSPPANLPKIRPTDRETPVLPHEKREETSEKEKIRPSDDARTPKSPDPYREPIE